MATITDIAPDRRARATGASADDNPCRHRMALAGQLLENRLGDVVVAAPVRGTLRVGELVHEQASAGASQSVRLRIDRRGVLDQMTAPTLELDQCDLARTRRRGHDCDERQPKQAREIRLRHRG